MSFDHNPPPETTSVKAIGHLYNVLVLRTIHVDLDVIQCLIFRNVLYTDIDQNTNELEFYSIGDDMNLILCDMERRLRIVHTHVILLHELAYTRMDCNKQIAVPN